MFETDSATENNRCVYVTINTVRVKMQGKNLRLQQVIAARGKPWVLKCHVQDRYGLLAQWSGVGRNIPVVILGADK